MEIQKHQQICPRCNGEQFRVYLVNAKDFFPMVLSKKAPDLIFETFECTNCGWTSHDLTEDGLKKQMNVALKVASIPRFETREEILTNAGIKRFKLKVVKE